MERKIIRALLAFALLLCLSSAIKDIQCTKYTCKTSSQNFDPLTCAYLDNSSNTYYAQACAKSTDDCFQVQGFNYSCGPTYTSGISFPGEECKSANDCHSLYTAGCKDGICVGSAEGQDCNSSRSCEPNFYCQLTLNICKPLIKIGETGCLNDYECVNNAACNVTDINNPSLNTCYPWHSFGVHDPVGGCESGISALCPYNYCQENSDTNFYCTDLLSSPVTPASQCDINSSDNCQSTSDPFFTPPFSIKGTCSCGLNSQGNANCQIFPGDLPYQAYLKQLNKWNSSEHITKCNTMRRFHKNCVKTYWSKKESDAFSFYQVQNSMYSQIQGSESCVLDAFALNYVRAKDEYNGGDDDNDDNNSGAKEICISMLILIAIS
ncbi:unnamed protein product [Blepharisma stoltei]|uniref:Dickkopf N-terminal cysteine-rich domain-containing protein n=1 Tax=Blepharisma stoltei TaxID=1481888 RepID=A0AAU9JUH9_9CILI|nr:unnamed protein product [Blepharisma stoltei]